MYRKQNIIMGNNQACSIDDMVSLEETLRYTIVSFAAIDTIAEALSNKKICCVDHVIYTQIYFSAKKRFNNNLSVQLSVNRIASAIHKCKKTVRASLQKLQSLGFLVIKSVHKADGGFDANEISVRLPESAIEKIRETYKPRKKSANIEQESVGHNDTLASGKSELMNDTTLSANEAISCSIDKPIESEELSTGVVEKQTQGWGNESTNNNIIYNNTNKQRLVLPVDKRENEIHLYPKNRLGINLPIKKIRYNKRKSDGFIHEHEKNDLTKVSRYLEFHIDRNCKAWRISDPASLKAEGNYFILNNKLDDPDDSLFMRAWVFFNKIKDEGWRTPIGMQIVARNAEKSRKQRNLARFKNNSEPPVRNFYCQQ